MCESFILSTTRSYAQSLHDDGTNGLQRASDVIGRSFTFHRSPHAGEPTEFRRADVTKKKPPMSSRDIAKYSLLLAFTALVGSVMLYIAFFVMPAITP